MRVLQISVHFHPNVGGVETHLTDLVKALSRRGWKVTVLSYRPLTTDVRWDSYEKTEDIEIIRLPWLPNLFYRLISYPAVEFIYLLPGLFIVCPFIILNKKPEVIHAHGLVAGFVGVFWGKIFRKKIIISTHNVYNFPKQGLYREFARWIFSNADKVLGLSQKSVSEIKALGVPERNVDRFTYWVDLKLFEKVINTKKRLKQKEKLVVLFAGRLIKEKGIDILLKSFQNWNRKIKLIIAGSGPSYPVALQLADKFKNLKVINIVGQDKLPDYYSTADLTIMPSVSEEGFGRVILESLACGTPVIASNRGGIPEAMDETVGKFIKVTPQNIKDAVEYFLNHKSKLKELSLNCRKFAERRYDEKNVEDIIRAYTS